MFPVEMLTPVTVVALIAALCVSACFCTCMKEAAKLFKSLMIIRRNT